MSELKTADILPKCGSLENYEYFRLRWIRACMKVNKKSTNSNLLKEAEKRIEEMICEKSLR